jgi:hypothetical protein
MCDDCSKTGAAGVEENAVGTAQLAVLARAPQGFDARIKVRLLPAKDVVLERPSGCQPRAGAPRKDAHPLDLPEGLPEKIKDASKGVIAWLARDPANTRLYLADPVAGLVAAGVELTRAEQKALSRAHQPVREASVVPPGVEVTELTVKAVPRGKVGDFKPADETSTGAAGC